MPESHLKQSGFYDTLAYHLLNIVKEFENTEKLEIKNIYIEMN